MNYNNTEDNIENNIEDDLSFDPFTCIDLEITDDLLLNAKIAAYMFDQQLKTPEGEVEPYAPKKFPEKAIDIMFNVKDAQTTKYDPEDGFEQNQLELFDSEKKNKKDEDDDIQEDDGSAWVEIYLDTKDKMWDSKFVIDGKFGKLSPDQMEQFFKSNTYQRITEKIRQTWPLSDPMYNELFQAIEHKCLRIGMSDEDMIEYNSTLDGGSIDEVDQAGKRVDLANKDVTGDGERDYSGSGRKIIHFGDMGVKGKSAEYYCWPRRNKQLKWNSWANWEKIKPFARMTFVYNGRKYMITLSLNDEGLDNRGFRGADLTWTPPLAWLTPTECQEVMELSIVRKFLRQCVLRVKPLVDMDPAEIYSKIDKPDKLTEKDIEKTQRVIKHMLATVFRNEQADNYKYD